MISITNSPFNTASRSLARPSRKTQIADFKPSWAFVYRPLSKHLIEGVATGLPNFSGRECPFSRDLRGAANVVA
jgi:hypothetical protein